jgi:hypothetical protein
VAGPTGPTGPQGPTGATGAGSTGATGPTGPASPLGQALVNDGSTTSANNPIADVVVSDTATCTGGKVIVGGGGFYTVTGGAAQRLKVAETSSIATSTTVWTYSVTVNTALTAGNTVTVTAQAICATP